MTKINYLRKCFTENYNQQDLESAAKIGEILLREHWHNCNTQTKGYANDLFNLACVYDETGNLERAAELYSDSARQIAMLEGEGLSFAERVNSLATVLARLGITEPAFFMMGSATAIRRRELGAQSPIYADSLYNLANIASDVGKRKESLRYHLALEIRENEGHTDDIINSLHSIAFLHEAASEYEKAIHYAETAMRYSIGDDETYARSCNYLAGLYEVNKSYKAALPLYEQVLEITVTEAGREHSAYLNVSLRRANLLALMEREYEALSAYEEVRDTFARISGTQHIFYTNCLRGMAMLHKNLGNAALAESLIMEAMKIRRTMCEDIMLDITFLIRLHLQAKNPEKALEALIYALMCSGSNSQEYKDMLSMLVEMFQSTDLPVTSEFITAMEVLNDREKIRPILNKWTAWENE
ncbi:MAG: tetratricopeptide repeat protein [Defluviitaleaceae bacterium]|nr:tetratricopeptide repeat protein [Defluviitaleaceae bacterium]